MAQSRVVITKDRDFQHSFLISGKPYKLVLVSTGNIGNTALLELFKDHLAQLLAVLETHHYLEIGANQLLLHG